MSGGPTLFSPSPPPARFGSGLDATPRRALVTEGAARGRAAREDLDWAGSEAERRKRESETDQPS
jgi:hypothetical protein